MGKIFWTFYFFQREQPPEEKPGSPPGGKKKKFSFFPKAPKANKIVPRQRKFYFSPKKIFRKRNNGGYTPLHPLEKPGSG